MTNSLTALLAAGVAGVWFLDFVLLFRVFSC